LPVGWRLLQPLLQPIDEAVDWHEDPTIWDGRLALIYSPAAAEEIDIEAHDV
jgi:hypothetical protein